VISALKSDTVVILAVLPLEWGQNLRYYCGSGSRIHGIPAVMGQHPREYRGNGDGLCGNTAG